MQNIIDLLICKIGILFVVLVPRLVSNDVLFLLFYSENFVWPGTNIIEE